MLASGICLSFFLLTAIGGVAKNRIVLSSSHLSPISETQLEVEIYATEEGVLVDLSEAQIEWGDVYGKLQFSNEEGARATASAVDKDGLALDMTRITANVTLVDGSEFGLSTFAKIFRPWGEKLTPMPRSINMDMGTASNFTGDCPQLPTESYFLQEIWFLENGELHVPAPWEAFWYQRGLIDFVFDQEAQEASFTLSPWPHNPPHVTYTAKYRMTPIPGANPCAWGLEWKGEVYDGEFVTCWNKAAAFEMMYILECAGRLFFETTTKLTFDAYLSHYAYPPIIGWSFDVLADPPTSGAPTGCLVPERDQVPDCLT